MPVAIDRAVMLPVEFQEPPEQGHKTESFGGRDESGGGVKSQ